MVKNTIFLPLFLSFFAVLCYADTKKKGGVAVQQIVPSYYAAFRCVGAACRHNCCIGWEIDIDADTAAFYRTVGGELGRRLQDGIAYTDGEPHFRLDSRRRCPFLNGDNLCDIIQQLGEERLCGICADHPRFRNDLPDRVEIGLGLCCEEAARLILGWKEPMTLMGSTATDDAILRLRDAVIATLQNRGQTIPQRVDAMLMQCGAALPPLQPDEWASVLLTLERLEPAWTVRLEQLRDRFSDTDLVRFDRHMAERQTEYEQLLVYAVYRHLANAADATGIAARAAVAALFYTLIRALGAVQWAQTGTFTLADQVELVREFSTEIEYSDENWYVLLEMLT